nr:MAG: RNA-dependent RNA polymerase [Guiyang mito-like virus 6]
MKNLKFNSRNLPSPGSWNLAQLRSRKLKEVKRKKKLSKKDRFTSKLKRCKDMLIAVSNNYETHPDFVLRLKFVLHKFESVHGGLGLEQSIKWMKNSRLALVRFFTKRPLQTVDMVTLKHGIPVWLLPYINTDSPSHSEFRMWMTILSFTRSFNTKPRLDVEPIVTPSRNQMYEISDYEILRVAKELKLGRFEWKWSEFHQTTKSGPNGQALATSLCDLKSLPDVLLDALKLIGGKEFRVKRDKLSDETFDLFWRESLPYPTTRRIRKLSFFADKEAKTRVIGIVDYWSQTILKPLHEWLNTRLKAIKNDCTFDQDKFRSLLGYSGPFYSLDLKNATDRMPVSFQERILRLLVGSFKARLWKSILTDYAFDSDVGPILYRAGQPMGAYSSWPMMALTHHFIVRISAHRNGIINFTDYALLGDDIVIRDHKVAETYKHLLGILDMPISEQKTHISEDTYEFAKRWVYKGEEVTPFSVSGLFETWKSYPLFQNFLETQQRNGWVFRKDKAPGLFLHDIMKVWGKSQQGERSSRLLSIYNLFKTYVLKEDSMTLKELIKSMDLRTEEFSYEQLEFFCKASLTRTLQDQVIRDIAKLNAARMDYMYKSVHMVNSFALHYNLEAAETNRLWLSFLDDHPIPQLFDYKINSIEKLLKKVQTGSYTFAEAFTSQELMTKFWTDEVFAMRTANSRLFAQSRLLKDFWKIMKSYCNFEEVRSVSLRDFKKVLDPKVYRFLEEQRVLRALRGQ